MYADHSFCYIMKVTDIFKISNLTERYTRWDVLHANSLASLQYPQDRVGPVPGIDIVLKQRNVYLCHGCLATQATWLFIE